MRCTSPRTVGYNADGQTLCWSQKKYSKEYPTFQLPCGKCLDCRLEYSRSWAVRCVHESMVHSDNSFVTLTYDDDHLGDNRLNYSHVQDFLKRLRSQRFEKFVLSKGISSMDWKSKSTTEKKEFRKEYKAELEAQRINYFVTGEYGDEKNRMHWHVLLFNYSPDDLVYKYTTDLGDTVYSSESLNGLWGKGNTDVGSVTFESAGYVARYAAKKLKYGYDQDHPYQPISKKSSKIAIGRRWLEKYWKDVFNEGKCILMNGHSVPIPRYYVKWLEKYHPDEYVRWMTKTKVEMLREFKDSIETEKKRIFALNETRVGKGPQITALEHRKKITNAIMNFLNSYSKL